MGSHFSIELRANNKVDKMILKDNKEGFLFEGDLGDFLSVSLLEETLLEMLFIDGALRLEIDESMRMSLFNSLSVNE